MQLLTVTIVKPEATNFVLGQSHFIKSVEDLHEAMVGTVPGIKFGLAFCEASGKRLVRRSGTDTSLIELACQNAMAIGAGHSFIIFLGDGFYPVNVLNAIKAVPEVCRIFCATANPTQVLLAETDQGRGSWVLSTALGRSAWKTKRTFNGARICYARSVTRHRPNWSHSGSRPPAHLIRRAPVAGRPPLFIVLRGALIELWNIYVLSLAPCGRPSCVKRSMRCVAVRCGRSKPPRS